MPTEREKIEAELQIGEHERFAAADLRQVMGDLDDLEADLAALQDKAGLPRFDRSKPLTEWLTILDISKELDRTRQSMPRCRGDQRRTGAAETCQGIVCRAQQGRTVCACSA